jgi:hypothetical protein
MGQDDEYNQHSKSRCRYREEIDRGDLFGVVVEEGRPGNYYP